MYLHGTRIGEYGSDLHAANSSPWPQGLCTGIEEITFQMCSQELTTCLKSASVAYRFQTMSFLKILRGWTSLCARSGVWEDLCVTPQPWSLNQSQGRLALWNPVISKYLDPLRSTWLSSDLQQTLT